MPRSRNAKLAALALASCTPAGAQVPPPPLLPGQQEIAEKLVRAFDDKDEAAYAGLLADDVRVFEDGEKIASNRQEWTKRFGPTLSAKGVSFKLTPGFVSTGRILFIEYVNSLASWGRTPPPDCCWRYDAVAYDIVDGKIKVIKRLKGGESRLGEKGQVIGN